MGLQVECGQCWQQSPGVRAGFQAQADRSFISDSLRTVCVTSTFLSLSFPICKSSNVTGSLLSFHERKCLVACAWCTSK